MRETTENCGGGIEKMVCEDRISDLSDDLLIQILSLVPIKDVVATMILSKRWRYIWTLIPRLEYKENNNVDDNGESKVSVWWFLDKSMELHQAHVLTILSMELGRLCPTDVDVGKWVANAADRRVRVLKFKLLWSADPARLPKSLYTCETLVELTLSHKILVDFPSSSFLPSLKSLKLYYVVYEDEDSLVRFLSSCPVLEILRVKRKNDDNVTKFSVKVPSLRRLSYDNCTDDDDVVVDNGRCLVVDTPGLTHFVITDYSGDSCWIENMPFLEDAYIDVESFHDIHKLISSVSSALSLELVLTNDMIVCCSTSTIKFSRLVKCKLYPCDADWVDSLVAFLGKIPTLKFLIVDYRLLIYQPPVPSASWSEMGSYPECLLSSLEKFELIEYEGREEEQELVEYILDYSRCLKMVTIFLKDTLKIEDRETIMEKLRAIHMFSFSKASLKLC